MSLISVDGHSVFRGSITMPLVGVWTADLDIDVTENLKAGPTTIEVMAGVPLVGTVVSGELTHGYLHARIVGGAAGMSKPAAPKHYDKPKAGEVIADLAKTAGETVSPLVAAAVRSRALLAWTTLRRPIGDQLSALLGSALPLGTRWRILPDGTLWVGAETWPAADTEVDWREMERWPAEGRLELGLDSANLLPGTVLGEDRIGYVEHRIDQQGVRATAWLAQA